MVTVGATVLAKFGPNDYWACTVLSVNQRERTAEVQAFHGAPRRHDVLSFRDLAEVSRDTCRRLGLSVS